MARTDSEPDVFAPSTEEREYNAPSRVRHTTRGHTRRLTFFALTAAWGTLAGVGGLLASLGLAGEPVYATGAVVVGLALSLVASVSGAWVLAAAYEASKRRK